MSDTAQTTTSSVRRLPNLFDLAAMLVIAAGLIAVANVARHTLAPLASVATLPIDLDPIYLPGYALRTTLAHVRGSRRVAAVHLHLRHLGRQEPPRAPGAHSDPGHSAEPADLRLPHVHRNVLPGPFPRPARRRRVRRGFHDLHQPGLEHDVQHVPEPHHGARRSRRSQPRLSPFPLAALSGASRSRSRCPA